MPVLRQHVKREEKGPISKISITKCLGVSLWVFSPIKKCVQEDLIHGNRNEALDIWKFTYNLRESMTFFENFCILHLKNLYHKYMKKGILSNYKVTLDNTSV